MQATSKGALQCTSTQSMAVNCQTPPHIAHSAKGGLIRESFVCGQPALHLCLPHGHRSASSTCGGKCPLQQHRSSTTAKARTAAIPPAWGPAPYQDLKSNHKHISAAHRATGGDYSACGGTCHLQQHLPFITAGARTAAMCWHLRWSCKASAEWTTQTH